MSASLPPAPVAGARRGPGDPAATGVRQLLWAAVTLSLLLSLLAVGWDAPLWHDDADPAVGPRLLAACAMLLLGVVVIGGGSFDRALRDVPRRQLPWTLVALGGVVVGLGQTVGYAAVAGQVGAFPAWVQDGPTVLAGVLLGTGVVLAAWPPGMSRREASYVVVDTSVAAVALLILWQLYVLPLGRNDDGQSPLSDLLVVVDLWWQWGALVVIVLIAATSRRSGSLSFRQLLLMQGAFGIFVLSDLAGDVVPAADASSSVTPSVVGYALAGAVFVAVITRRGVEPDPPSAAVMRERYAITMPGAVLVVALVGMLVYRLTKGAFPAPTVVTVIGLFCLATVAAVVSRLRAEREFRTLAQLRASMPLEQAVREGWLTALVGDAQDVVCLVDAGGRILYVTPSVRSVLALDVDHLSGTRLDEHFADLDALAVSALLLRAAHDEADRGPHEIELLHTPGGRRDVELRIAPLRSDGSDYFVVTMRDVSDHRRLRAELTALQDRDALTGLPNRSAFLQRVDETVPLSAVGTVGVLLLDLDSFSDLNDGRGQDVGDMVLKEVASALDRLPRQVISVARVGGDEFAVMVADPELEPAVGEVVRALADALGPVLLPDGTSVRVAFSGGYSVASDASVGSTEMMERSDLAMRSAKATGRSLVRYSTELREGLRARMRAEVQLREALDDDRIVVHYQPVLRLTDTALVGFEALVRLRDPDGTLVPPQSFIPRAEELGLIDRLGQRVLDIALRDSRRLVAELGRELTMAVNVSVSQLTPAFVLRTRALLAARGVPASSLMIELTESALAESPEQVATVLGGLRRLGVRVALDDFGTGYSSLSYLAGLPVDELKIDRSFVTELGTSSTSLTLARTVVQLARALDLLTVAEGVETVEQADLLRGMGCQLGQGYLYSRPQPVEAILTILGAGGDLPAWSGQGTS